MSIVIDTNVLMDFPKALDEYSDIILPITVVEELDRLKIHRDKDKAYKARRAIKKLEGSNDITYALKSRYDVPCDLDKDKADNTIIMCAKFYNAILITNDLAMKIKATGLGVKTQKHYDIPYTGIELLEGTTQDILDFYQEGGDKELIENQYLIIRNTETGDERELVCRGGVLKPLSLPDSKVIKGWNAEQRCALDMLNNKDIPIKIICGVAGSGKTKLAVALGADATMDNKYETLFLVRNIIGSGEDIGFLPGSLEEKTGMFYQPIIENVGEEVFTHMMERKKIEKNIPFHMKGITIKDSFCVVDEAEDMDLKTLKLVGTRIGEGSVVVFCGDYAQAESKFSQDNGLVKTIDALKGNPLVGIVVLSADVRSKASKLFADI